MPVTGPRAKFPTALPVKRRVWILVVGVSAVLAGVAIIAWPKRTVYVVAWVFASALIAGGLLRLLAAFADPDGSQDREVHLVLQAIAGLGVGIYLLFNSAASLVLLMIVVSIYWFVHGLIDLTAIARTGQWTERAWVLASGTIALVVGLVLTISLEVPEGFRFPHQSLDLLRGLLGSWLVLYGLLLIPRGAWRAARARRSS